MREQSKSTEASTPAATHPLVGRFAPSPTGRMHAGNIFAALTAWLVAHKSGGYMVLRIEDLDAQRSKPWFSDQVQRDFETLGLTWEKGPFYQHDRIDAYESAFKVLEEKGLVYPCFCTRADLHAASAPHRGEKLVYPGTCRNLSADEIRAKAKERPAAWRVRVPARTYGFDDAFQGRYSQNLATDCGDFLVKRSDGAFAYQLAVVLDDAEQGITSVVRGVDLITSSPQQMYLQDVLGASHPQYAHVPLLVAKRDRRLSKRDHDASMDVLLESLGTPEAVIGHIAYRTGMIEADEPISPEKLLHVVDLDALRRKWEGTIQIPWNDGSVE